MSFMSKLVVYASYCFQPGCVLAVVEKLKGIGNDLFKGQNNEKALKKYRKAIRYLNYNDSSFSDSDDESEEMSADEKAAREEKKKKRNESDVALQKLLISLYLNRYV